MRQSHKNWDSKIIDVINKGVLFKLGQLAHTVDSLLTDTPNKGHCIKYLSTMDKTKPPNFNPPINIMQLEYLNSIQSLYSGQTA